ncbi:Gfo/Idh/MocA family protein [Fervidibacillus albus]|uniref:Gfo/Idh/MocA family oxidoreductase n=1 Tax=Fervidibacillus albus TaxID=2980026 RepID=A0A9E8LV04_9BACI|nr:Gfo/Idh/MocA family oxidoreductase [Fervidibacillus albus]WAA10084.1 Gfo/Idh/MocA family oxidoreductase [Fervidibacillus albus]
MENIRVGIIGTGFGAKVHAPMFQHHNHFNVVSIATVSGKRVEETKKISGVENIYTNWKEMLEKEDLDLVVISSAPFLHKEMVVEALHRGIHVLCEKPMALNKEEAIAMCAAQKKAKKFGFINHEWRFLPARLKVKEIIEKGTLGTVHHIRYIASYPLYSSLTSRKWGWLGDREKGGGMLGAIGSHMIDSLYWWTASEFAEVFANLFSHVPEFRDEQGAIERRTADDGFQVNGKLKNGTTVTLELATAIRKPKQTYLLEIFGSKGSLVMTDDHDIQLSIDDKTFERVEFEPDLVPPKAMTPVVSRYYNGFYQMLDALADSFHSTDKHPVLADFEDGLRVQRALDGIRQSANEERKITI